MVTVVCGLLEEDPKVRMSVGEAHRALASEQDAARTDPAPDALAGVEDALSSKGCVDKGSKLHAKMATLMLLYQTRRKRAAREQGSPSPRVAAQLLSKASRAKKRTRS